MHATIYVVRGQTGEYSDRIEWPVLAFRSVDLAKAYVLKLEEKAAAMLATMPKDLKVDYDKQIEYWSSNDLDPAMVRGDEGIMYYYESVRMAAE